MPGTSKSIICDGVILCDTVLCFYIKCLVSCAPSRDDVSLVPCTVSVSHAHLSQYLAYYHQPQHPTQALDTINEGHTKLVMPQQRPYTTSCDSTATLDYADGLAPGAGGY
jgi:hypothetical protein